MKTAAFALLGAAAYATCASDIEAAGQSFAKASQEITKAVTDCETDAVTCAQDISMASAYFAEAAQGVTKAVGSCGGEVSQCALDVEQVMYDMAMCTNAIAGCVVSCDPNNYSFTQCPKDITTVLKETGTAVEDIAKAT